MPTYSRYSVRDDVISNARWTLNFNRIARSVLRAYSATKTRVMNGLAAAFNSGWN